MNELPVAGPPAIRGPQQVGHPLVRVQATDQTIYPFALEIGDYAVVRVPMTVAGLGALRDALSALLAGATPAEPDDFVTEWARAHGATIVAA